MTQGQLRAPGAARIGPIQRVLRARWIRVLFAVARDVALVRWVDRATWAAILRADLGDPSDPAVIPALQRATAAHSTPALHKRLARALGRVGEPSAARRSWEQVLPHDRALVERSIATLDGLLRETDSAWLPTLDIPTERLTPARPGRVLHIVKNWVPERWSGYTIRTLHNLRSQVGAGLEPMVATDIGWPREAGVSDVAPSVTYEGIVHYQLDRGPGYDRESMPRADHIQHVAEDLVPVVREARPAILHAHSGHRGGEFALAALALRERFGIPVVYEIRGLFEVKGLAGEGSELYTRRLAQEDRIVRDVDAVLAISEALADELVARGCPRSKITIIPNGIDTAEIDRTHPDEGLRARLGIAGREVVGYVGNLDAQLEGLEVAMAALPELRRLGHDAVLLIVGEGHRVPRLERRARELGVLELCRFTGRVPHTEIANYYRAIDVFILPRLDQRAARLITPLKPYEAMAVGIPVLVSDLPALREVVDPPNRGAVTPPEDPLALARAIADLLEDPERRARMAAAGRAWVRAQRPWSTNGQRYRSAYEAVVGPIPS